MYLHPYAIQKTFLTERKIEIGFLKILFYFQELFSIKVFLETFAINKSLHFRYITITIGSHALLDDHTFKN